MGVLIPAEHFEPCFLCTMVSSEWAVKGFAYWLGIYRPSFAQPVTVLVSNHRMLLPSFPSLLTCVFFRLPACVLCYLRVEIHYKNAVYSAGMLLWWPGTSWSNSLALLAGVCLADVTRSFPEELLSTPLRHMGKE